MGRQHRNLWRFSEVYFPKYAKRFTESELSKMTLARTAKRLESMEYNDFLEARRKLMAGIIREEV
ncbi:MAG: hypothetical protein R3C18_17585 [Planctomycetaceae bacterium]